ncbi:MAG: hypothetical protein QNK23_16705 [Crocinitomicaceae bacterium]|nr:hypothetical protein [Crocinitomicaceae bacterium]
MNTSTANLRPKELKIIAVLIGITMMRIMSGAMIPSLEMYGGENPDAWFAPWLSDAVLGLLAPYMIYLALKKNGVKVWASLLVYNSIGAFDYVHGLLTQWTDPLVPNGLMGTPELTYGSVAFSLIVQLTIIYFLARPNVMNHFISEK